MFPTANLLCSKGRFDGSQKVEMPLESFKAHVYPLWDVTNLMVEKSSKTQTHAKEMKYNISLNTSNTVEMWHKINVWDASNPKAQIVFQLPSDWKDHTSINSEWHWFLESRLFSLTHSFHKLIRKRHPGSLSSLICFTWKAIYPWCLETSSNFLC